MKLTRVGVVGAGVIGTGVAQSLAQTKHEVVLVDLSHDILHRARQGIARNVRFSALFDPELRKTDPATILNRITVTTDVEQLQDVDIVIENSTEKRDVKQAIYPRLDSICRTACIFAANTSAIPIGWLADLTRRPDCVIGMHFMNPVPQKTFVEVVLGADTSDATLEAAKQFLAQMNKQAIVVNDMPGFVSNRVLMLTINEAIQLVQDGVAVPEDVDAVFVKCMSHKIGPLATADLIGLDTVLLTLEVLRESFNDDKFQPCPLLRQMVDSGLHGRKSGEGFFKYSELGAN